MFFFNPMYIYIYIIIIYIYYIYIPNPFVFFWHSHGWHSHRIGSMAPVTPSPCRWAASSPGWLPHWLASTVFSSKTEAPMGYSLQATGSSQTTLVGGWATPLKNMSSSIGMISNPIYGKIKNGNQTTNQYKSILITSVYLLFAAGSKTGLVKWHTLFATALCSRNRDHDLHKGLCVRCTPTTFPELRVQAAQLVQVF